MGLRYTVNVSLTAGCRVLICLRPQFLTYESVLLKLILKYIMDVCI